MRTMREAIIDSRFPEFVIEFVNNVYPNKNYPTWVVNSLNSVEINLDNYLILYFHTSSQCLRFIAFYTFSILHSTNVLLNNTIF